MRDSFLDAVLGQDGAAALRKAAVREPALSAVLVPRTLLGWLSLAARAGQYTGSVPGIQDSHLSLKKTDEGLLGEIEFDGHRTFFSQAGLLHVASAVAVTLGLDDTEAPAALAKDVSNLGKTVDLLLKAKLISEAAELKKSVLSPDSGYTFKTFHKPNDPLPSTTVHAFSQGGEHVGYATFHHIKGNLHPFGVYVDDDHQRKGVASHMYSLAEQHTGLKIVPSKNQTKEGAALWEGNSKTPQFGKAELPGKPAMPVEQKGAQAPSPPEKAPARKAPKSARPRSLMLSEKQICKKCDRCGGSMLKGDSLVGCLCWRELCPGTTLQKTEDGYRMDFGGRWDEDAIDAFVASVGGRRAR